jgi:hypothetical protein
MHMIFQIQTPEDVKLSIAFCLIVVDHTGFEPVAFPMPWERSTN